MGYREIEVAPVAGALGAEIGGVDISEPLADDTFEEIRRAFLEYRVIFFRGQTLPPAASATSPPASAPATAIPSSPGWRNAPR